MNTSFLSKISFFLFILASVAFFFACANKDQPTSTFTVSFNSRGGTVVASQQVSSGGKATKPTPDPTRSVAGYAFNGWYADTLSSTQFNFAVTAITSSITLYAKWDTVKPLILTFAFLKSNNPSLTQDVSGVINNTQGTVVLTLPYDVSSDTKKTLVPTITYQGTDLTPASGTAKDFTGSQTYTVSALGGTTKAYTVTAPTQLLSWVKTSTNKDTFTARSQHATVVFNNKMWVIGGQNSQGNLNDVWSSADGITWTKQTTVGSIFSARHSHSAVVFNNKIWVIAGGDASNYYNDVWSSADGLTWTQETAQAAFSARTRMKVLVGNNKLWLIGGLADGPSYKNDVWSSTDGKTWTSVQTAAPFDGRSVSAAVVLNDSMFVFGGYNGSYAKYYNDVWKSKDWGVTWTKVIDPARFSAREGLSSAVQDGKIWLFGGTENAADASTYKNDSWYSADGLLWSQPQITGTVFAPRRFHTTVVFNNKLWILGGEDYYTAMSDVWSLDLKK